MESGGLLLNSTISALFGRYLLVGFARDHSLVSAEGTMMADGFVTMLQLAGMAMMIAIRAALIPSRPRRTIIVTALFGVPAILVATVAGPGCAMAGSPGARSTRAPIPGCRSPLR